VEESTQGGDGLGQSEGNVEGGEKSETGEMGRGKEARIGRTTKEREEVPWGRGRSSGPGETWQPESWDPSKGGARR
jgi:hypothetical protein